MRVRTTPESQLCAFSKNVLFSISTLLDQRNLQFINKALINCKDLWSNKSGLENRTFFEHAHYCVSGVMRVRMGTYSNYLMHGPGGFIAKVYGKFLSLS
jgi:hypothetical protein